MRLPDFSIRKTLKNGKLLYCSFDIDELPNSGYPPLIWISRIFVPKEYRGHKHGGKMLNRFCKWCDKKRRDVILQINPYGDLDEEQLRKWYIKHGFVSQKDGSMIRHHKV